MCCYWEQSNKMDLTPDGVISYLINELNFQEERMFLRDITVFSRKNNNFYFTQYII